MTDAPRTRQRPEDVRPPASLAEALAASIEERLRGEAPPTHTDPAAWRRMVEGIRLRWAQKLAELRHAAELFKSVDGDLGRLCRDAVARAEAAEARVAQFEAALGEVRQKYRAALADPEGGPTAAMNSRLLARVQELETTVAAQRADIARRQSSPEAEVLQRQCEAHHGTAAFALEALDECVERGCDLGPLARKFYATRRSGLSPQFRAHWRATDGAALRARIAAEAAPADPPEGA